jgi:phage gp45-like
MVSRAVLSSLASEGGIQKVQLKLLADEVTDDAQNFQEFGFISKPPAGTEAVALSVGGNREHVVVVATNNRAARAALSSLMGDGDSMFFNNSQKYLMLKGDNLEGSVSKVKIENDSNELISVLVEWIEQHIANRNITAIGPQPLYPPDLAALEAIKAKLETFKV